MSKELRLYRGGEIASESQSELQKLDVMVEGERIRHVGTNLDCSESDAEVIDCEGKILLPGLFDLHVHSREPGFVEEAAALRGGITGLVLMPDCGGDTDTADAVRTLHGKTCDQQVDVHIAGAITKERAGQELAAIAGMDEVGIVMLTDSGSAVENPQLLRRAMEYARNFDLLLASHCETPSPYKRRGDE